ncbi:MAG: TetR/AcrR family transcriptional regulator [Prevotellaceae bacterium]|jgi:AcrR family transcriptional regulator|nr:TetR/AcrR family transcriptional regulator [Prevotellaceae bacterium]
MPRTKEQYEQIRSEKRKIIKQVALKLFATKGYATTSINDIAQTAGISKGLMYNYFKSKEEVLQTIWDELTEEFVTMIDPNHDGEITPEESKNFIDKTFELLINRREEMKLYFQCSFQPDVIKFLEHKYLHRVAAQQKFIIGHFAGKLPVADKQHAYFSVHVFLKGLGMVITYAEHLYADEFLMNYKEFLKKIIYK